MKTQHKLLSIGVLSLLATMAFADDVPTDNDESMPISELVDESEKLDADEAKRSDDARSKFRGRKSTKSRDLNERNFAISSLRSQSFNSRGSELNRYTLRELRDKERDNQ